jgi:hypothetical protein
MAAKKAKKKKAPAKKRPRIRYRGKRRFFVDASPAERRWRVWVHDVDTLLHELVRNPALAEHEPSLLVARAEAFADAYQALQDRRRPPGMPEGRDL